MPRAPSLRSLFLAWVCFSIAFSTVFQAFLTTFLSDSGYITPIQNLDELFGSGMKLVYDPIYSSVFKYGDETKASHMRRNQANCPSLKVCMDWAKQHKNVSLFVPDDEFEILSENNSNVGENGEPLLCRIDDGVFLNYGTVMLMLYGEPLLKRVNTIFRRVVEAGLYKCWVSQFKNRYKIAFQKKALVNPLDECYSFNLYHMQPAFYLLLIGLCLSVFCFVIEVFCYRVLNKTK
jgi:hypothetical protein